MLFLKSDSSRKLLILFLVLANTMLLSSCAVFNRFFPDKRLDYQKHQSKSAIHLPEGMHASRIRDSMPVPPIADSLSKLPLPEKTVRPAPLKIGLMNNGVQKRSVGENVWLFVDKPPSQVWPELQNYLESRELSQALASPQSGLLEAGWIEAGYKALADALGSPDLPAFRFRIFLQPALQRNTAHVQVRISLDASSWPELSHTLALEELILDDIASFIAGRLDDQSSVSLLAQQMQRSFTVDLAERDGHEFLIINQDFNQSWVLVGKAIRDLSMPLYDLNRSFGLYYLSSSHASARDFSFTRRLDQFKSLKNHQDFQIHVIEEEDGCKVSVQLSDDTPADKAFSHFVLAALLKQIDGNK